MTLTFVVVARVGVPVGLSDRARAEGGVLGTVVESRLHHTQSPHILPAVTLGEEEGEKTQG